MPQMEKAAGWRANHHQLTVKVLPVEVHILQPPAFNITVKTTCQKVDKEIIIGINENDLDRNNINFIIIINKLVSYGNTIYCYSKGGCCEINN